MAGRGNLKSHAQRMRYLLKGNFARTLADKNSLQPGNPCQKKRPSSRLVILSRAWLRVRCCNIISNPQQPEFTRKNKTKHIRGIRSTKDGESVTLPGQTHPGRVAGERKQNSFRKFTRNRRKLLPFHASSALI